jgi:hypothetical protein
MYIYKYNSLLSYYLEQTTEIICPAIVFNIVWCLKGLFIFLLFIIFSQFWD